MYHRNLSNYHTPFIHQEIIDIHEEDAVLILVTGTMVAHDDNLLEIIIPLFLNPINRDSKESRFISMSVDFFAAIRTFIDCKYRVFIILLQIFLLKNLIKKNFRPNRVPFHCIQAKCSQIVSFLFRPTTNLNISEKYHQPFPFHIFAAICIFVKWNSKITSFRGSFPTLHSLSRCRSGIDWVSIGYRLAQGWIIWNQSPNENQI